MKRFVHTVVMVRHGESLWNVEKRFTGWCDVPLTKHGEADAIDAGILMGERGLKFDLAYTSNLERAWRTCAMVLSASGQSNVEILKSWRLNERHYGALQGHFKTSPQLIKVFGEDKLIEWRRSYNTAPPSLSDYEFFKQIGKEHFESILSQINPVFLDHSMRTALDNIYKTTNKSLIGDYSTHLPLTESLKQCEERAYGYWNKVIAPQVKLGKRVLIVAHANTIRALVKAIDRIDDDMIAHLKIPNGIPLVYTLDDDLNPILDDMSDDIGFQANYLVSARNHSKMMAYERCVHKKLRSLFEYLDTDGDGRITPQCLQSGINKLQSITTETNEIESNAVNTLNEIFQASKEILKPTMKRTAQITCEYEIEELLRCIPKADEHGGVTLQAFLESEETLLPQLTKLRLLQ